MENIEIGKFIAMDGVEAPKRATTGSAGYDFYAPMSVTIKPHESISFDSGVRVRLKEGYVLQLYIRSSLGKKGLVLTNTVGIIDSDYQETMQALLTNNSDKEISIKAGERYMQGLIMKYFVTDDDCTDGIRKGGFGSTGK